MNDSEELKKGGKKVCAGAFDVNRNVSVLADEDSLLDFPQPKTYLPLHPTRRPRCWSLSRGLRRGLSPQTVNSRCQSFDAEWHNVHAPVVLISQETGDSNTV